MSRPRSVVGKWWLLAVAGLASASGCQEPDSAPADSAVPKSAAPKPAPPVAVTPPPAVDVSGYDTPPPEIVAIVDAAPTPGVEVSPDGTRLLQVHQPAHPPLALVSRAFERLAGTRIDPVWGTRRKLSFANRVVVQRIDDGTTVPVSVAGDRLGGAQWSPDGTKISVLRFVDAGAELWVADAATGKATRWGDGHINDVLGRGCRWTPGSEALLCKLVPADRGPAPAVPAVPRGPVVEDTAGREAQNRTYQDLLKSPDDAKRFAHYARSQLARIDADGATPIGAVAMVRSAKVSVDGKRLLVDTLREPFSYSVPFRRFAHTLDVVDLDGNEVHTIADLDVADAVPIDGVPTGTRMAKWSPHDPATVVWAEALDDGDPRKEVEHRDRVLALADPFSGEPVELARVQHRLWDISFTEVPSATLLTEHDRDRRWLTTRVHDFGKPGAEGRVLVDRSMRDAYGDPGRPITTMRPDGHAVAVVEDGALVTSGRGATPQGNRPFIAKIDLNTGDKTELFRSPEDRYAQFVGRATDGAWVLRRESPTDPPNFVVRTAQGDERTLTEFADPHPSLTGIQKRVLTYKRRDGVPLSGTLYLPPGHTEGERVPLVVWAYPREFNDAGTAGQVRASPTTFTRLRSTSVLMFLTQGYAVLQGASMPVIGDPKTMNETFLDQIAWAAQAAVDAVVDAGVADPDRVGVGGHSYGAFMTANLLAHSDVFRAGIARSGAYNRSLTPFGFQNERRTLWEATPTYVKVSPLFAAHRIDEPILLIHGEADSNSGTFPLQSKRLFHALKGTGGTARLVLLPGESHGYRARESVLHVLAEQFAWFDEHVKNASPRPVAKAGKTTAGSRAGAR